MQVEETAIPEVKVVRHRVFADDRGGLFEWYDTAAYGRAGIATPFVQDLVSRSASRGTVRGLHFQEPPWAQAKLVRVVRGRILDVAVDIRPGSATFGGHVAVELDDASPASIFVPEGFAHGFCTLEDDTEVTYKLSNHYAPEFARELLWNDPALGISWPVAPAAAVLSEKDAAAPPLADLGLADPGPANPGPA